jgi:hypothetical protein
MLEIYDENDELKAVIEPLENSTGREGVMEIGVLGLSFTLPEFVRLDVNDYIDFLDVRYTLFDPYRPEHLSDQEFKYDVQFFDPTKWLERTQVRASVGIEEDEGTFALTDTARVHLQLYADNLNRIMGRNVWVVGDVIATDNVIIEYKGKSCLAGITELAETTGTEWWAEGYTLNLARCEHGENLVLEYGEGLKSLSKERNDKTPFFTRLYPIGGSRNIDRESYGHSNLQLPGGVKFIEKNTHYGIFEHSEAEAFSHIYPKRIGYVSTVRSEDVEDQEGKPYTIYYFKDDGLNFDPNDYEMAGLVKHIVFEGGLLNGNDFEANFNSETGEFELITQFPYENMQLPGGGLVPRTGDPYILWNIRLPREYEVAAEQEFLEASEKFIALGAIDTAVYKGKTNYINLDEREVRLVKGRRVLLVNKYHFDEGSRASRIIAISRNLSRPNDATIDCAYAVTPARIASIESQVGKLQAAFGEKLDNELRVLRSWDSTDPSEYNVFSSLRSRMEHLSRLYPDAARGFINFLKGIAVGEDASFAAAVSSPEFISGFLDGKGWAIRLLEEMNAAGVKEAKSVAEFDDVIVRRSLRVHTLVINQTRAENGNIVFSDGMKVDHVDAASGRIYLDTDGGTLYNPFHPDDILLSQRFSGMPSEENGYEVSKQYELVVSDAGIGEDGENRLDWISFRNFVGDLSAVAKGDVLVRVDNLTDPARKGIVMMVTNGVDAPYIDVVYGLKTDPDDAVKSRSGNLSGIIHPLFGSLHGFGHYAQNFYGVGDFRLRMGRDVQTAVDIIEGLSRTTMQKTMYALTEENNYLKNASFTERMEFWECENAVRSVTVGGLLLMQNRSLMSVKEIVAAMVELGGRNVLRIKDSFVRQANEHIRQPEIIEEEVITTGENGEEVAETKMRRPKLYLSFRMVCREPGTLTVGFEGAGQGSGEEGQEPLPFVVQEVAAGNENEPVTYTFEGTWDGTGDFVLKFTGDAYFDQLALTSRPLEDFKVQVSTRLEQTAERIVAEGKRIDELNRTVDTVGLEISAIDATLTLYGEHINDLDGSVGSVNLRINSLDSSLSTTAQRVNRIDGEVAGLEGQINQILAAGYITRPEGNMMWASKEYENGAKIISTINQTAEEIYIQANKIRLEGVVTANNYFRINTDGSFDANVGRIGGFEIGYGRIGAVASAGSSSGGGLAIYDDFFRVGGTNGYVMFGEDVIPASVGGAFTAVGRIVNKAPNTGAQWGFSTANYGLFIDVTGGTTNYGIHSNAPLMAPSFINTRLKRVTFGTGTYSLDFSQSSIFLAYASTAVNIIMPDEAAIRRMFNVSSLPSDFGYYFIITADHGTQRFTLSNIYNHDGNLQSWDFAQGDTAIILIKKYPTFRYQMISYRYNQ